MAHEFGHSVVVFVPEFLPLLLLLHIQSRDLLFPFVLGLLQKGYVLISNEQSRNEIHNNVPFTIALKKNTYE